MNRERQSPSGGRHLEKVDGDRVKAAAHRGIGDRGAGNDCFAVAASLKQRAKCRGSAGRSRTDHLNLKSHLNALIGVKNFIVAHIATNQLALNSIRLQRADLKATNKDRICSSLLALDQFRKLTPLSPTGGVDLF